MPVASAPGCAASCRRFRPEVLDLRAHPEETAMPGPVGARLGPIRQLGYVVEDLDSAVAAWQEQLGLGPWTILRNIELDCEFLGQASQPRISIALSYRGEQQIELIQQRNAAPSPYLKFVEQRRFGLHHTAFLSADIHGDVEALQECGLQLVCDIRMPGPGGGRYVYFASPIPGEQTFIELLEATALMKALFAKGIADALDWQGQGRPLDLNLGPILRMLRAGKALFSRTGNPLQ